MALRQTQCSQEKTLLGMGVKNQAGLVGVAMTSGESPEALCA